MKTYWKIVISILLIVFLVYFSGFSMDLLNVANDGANISGIILMLLTVGIFYFSLDRVWDFKHIIQEIDKCKDSKS